MSPDLDRKECVRTVTLEERQLFARWAMPHDRTARKRVSYSLLSFISAYMSEAS